MSNVVPFDTLAVALALRDEAGLDQKQAEGMARVLSRMLVADLATKTDLAETKAVLQRDLAETKAVLQRDLAETKTGLHGELAETKAALKADIRETELRLEAKIEAVKVDIIKWLFGTIVAQTGLIIAAVKLLH